MSGNGFLMYGPHTPLNRSPIRPIENLLAEINSSAHYVAVAGAVVLRIAVYPIANQTTAPIEAPHWDFESYKAFYKRSRSNIFLMSSLF